MSQRISHDLESLLEESVKIHGPHQCPGQVLGVRMALVGLREIGIEDPKGAQQKDFVVFVETDRCATDAIQAVTGCTLGKRTMKFMDYGKMAATFVNLCNGKAVRVLAREESREAAAQYAPGIEDKYSAQRLAYKIMPEEALFEVTEVCVELKTQDMPGRPLRRVRCTQCGEAVQDMREVYLEGKVVCRPCASGGYYHAKEKNGL